MQVLSARQQRGGRHACGAGDPNVADDRQNAQDQHGHRDDDAGDAEVVLRLAFPQAEDREH